jgi:hypothetical protein
MSKDVIAADEVATASYLPVNMTAGLTTLCLRVAMEELVPTLGLNVVANEVAATELVCTVRNNHISTIDGVTVTWQPCQRGHVKNNIATPSPVVALEELRLERNYDH